MQQKSRNKVLQTELENPLNVHRWRRLEGKDPETLELIQKINHLQKRLISKQEDLIDKDMRIEELQKLYNESKVQLSRQPKYEVHDEIRNLRDEIKKKNDKIIVLSTESSVYQIETNKAHKIIESMNEELNMVILFKIILLLKNNKKCIILKTKQKYLEIKRSESKYKETIGKLRKQKVLQNIFLWYLTFLFGSSPCQIFIKSWTPLLMMMCHCCH